MDGDAQLDSRSPREGFFPVNGGRLFFRQLGEGPAVVLLHGGPEFDCRYLIPEMDGLARSHRLIYYDQRGRGLQAAGDSPDEIGIRSEVADLESLRRHFELESMALVGHSWGAVLAIEYARRHPEHVSHLVLMNAAPASTEDFLVLREGLSRSRPAPDAEKMRALRATPEYAAGDPAVYMEFLRTHFASAFRRPELLETLLPRFDGLGPQAILAARSIDSRLMSETWLLDTYDPIPELARHLIQTLVLHGEHDFIPLGIAERLAARIPGAKLAVVPDTGHFAYMEAPDAVHREIIEFLKGAASSPPIGIA